MGRPKLENTKVKYTVYLSPDILQALQISADENARPLSQEINARLMQSL